MNHMVLFITTWFSTSLTMDSIQRSEIQPRRFGAKVARTYAEGPGLNVMGKRPLAELEESFPHRVRGSCDSCKDEDKKDYSGIVDVDFKGRLDVKNAIGTNIAKCVSGESGFDRQMPGKIISQRVLSNKKSVYVAVYLDSTKETLTEERLRHYSGIYTNASLRSGSSIKPLIVRMK